MGLIELIVLLVVVGVFLWIIDTQLPIAAPLKQLIRVVVIVVVVLYLVRIFLGDIPLPRLR